MIHLKNISKHYESKHGTFTALKNVSLNIESGQIFGIIGRSGAGKSTLVRCINLLEKPNQGSVKVNGIDLTALSDSKLQKERRHIGMIFQHFNLLDSLNVYDNIALPLNLAGHPADKIKSKVNELLDLVGLKNKQHNFPADLSGGQKQRVAIARALTGNPKVLLCDEATSALDPETTSAILKLLKDINQKLNLTIVCITHEMSVIKFFCDRALVMDEGEAVENASVLDIFTKAKHPVTQAILKGEAQNKLPKRLEALIHKTRGDKTIPVLRLSFVGDQVNQPILGNLHDELGVEVNILQAHLDWIADTEVGITVCELIGSDELVQKAKDSLKQHNIIIEELGYV